MSKSLFKFIHKDGSPTKLGKALIAANKLNAALPKRLYFSRGNAKLDKSVAVFSLPAGHTCPFAKDCRSQSDRVTGKITDGKHCQFRCYATLAENLFPKVRANRWNNLELIKNAKTVIGMANLIEQALIIRRNVKLVRFHQSGDFFSLPYFDAWLLVARQHPEWTFYGYTKALPLWVARLGSIPANFKLVASRGGTHDTLISEHKLRSARVVFTEKTAKRLGLEIDHDDSHVWNYDKDFAILLHGTQPAGSKAGKAWYQIKNHGPGGYYADYFHADAKHKAKAAKAKAKRNKVYHFTSESIKRRLGERWKFTPKLNGMRVVLTGKA